jgi:hypothetical protein
MSETNPSPRRRKLRLVREGEDPGDLVVVVRAAPATPAEVVEDVVTAAEFSAEAYVVAQPDGTRELLYGVSVYARRPGADADVLRRFSASPYYFEVSVGLLTATGFPVLPTGADPDHYEIQLVPGRLEGDPADAALIARAASRLVARAGDLQLNPFYAGGGEDSLEDSP